MKKINFSIFFTSIIVALIAGGIGGYMAAERKFKPAEGMIKIDPKDVLYFNTGTNDVAHEMSVRFRTNAGICTDATAAATSTSAVTPGVFEFADTTAYDLVVAVDSIKREISRTSSAVPTNFRAIFGVDGAGKTRLIVAGLNSSNAEYSDNLKIINGHLPCPYLCDINQSTVIMGRGALRSPCR